MTKMAPVGLDYRPQCVENVYQGSKVAEEEGHKCGSSAEVGVEIEL